MQPHPHTAFVNRPPRRRTRMQQLLLGSVALAVALLAALVLLGAWQAEASHPPALMFAVPTLTSAGSGDASVPAASEVLRNAPSVPDEAVSTF
ncbi:hypothetical protein [Variovorax soli]|mgnify:CR=1 FL=1|uniref:Uncharacterized protein n=1 Tax=Variovorax soli TaxID=376815 RepID=A0ABU1N907_9BURK|nr:hypothetical protein [Variovorax soli]MDR6534919.1 hypothetical protein [Variovorax soli]